MDFIISIIRALFRHRWVIISVTVLISLFAIFYTRHMRGGYDVKATLYTGIVSGYNLESEKRTDWSIIQNSMDNLISIIQAESTLKQVCLRLYARVLIKGDPNKDMDGITASSYRSTYDHVRNSPHGKEILALIDKTSEDKTVANLEKYMKPQKDNYIYGLFYYNHPFYSYNALKNIKVQRRLTSDLLDISYSSGDPGIAYNTVSILMEEFVNEYRRIRYGETDKVIEYFKSELERIGQQLRNEEDDLTKYNVEKRIINYYDETKEVAAINKEFELREQDALFAYNSTRSMLGELERHMDSNAKQVLKNMQFIEKVREASTLTGEISEAEAVPTNQQKNDQSLDASKKRLTQLKQELNSLSDSYVSHKYTKEGTSRTNIIEQWLEQTLAFEKAKAELSVVQDSRRELNERYVFFAPVGTTIKQKERSINFTERNYLTVLQSYNDALLRKKNLEMTSATLKVLNDATYPISANSTNRKQIVIASCVGTFFFLVLLFILIEFIDRTLRDAPRARKVTGFKIVGAIPYSNSSPQSKIYFQAAIQELSNSLLRYFTKRKSPELFIVNLFSTLEDSGQEELGRQLDEFWKSRNLRTRLLVYGEDFQTEDSRYLLAKSVTDFYTPQGEDILIVVYPALIQSNIPTELLLDSNVNLLVSPADRGWKTVDQQLASQFLCQVNKSDVPFRMCLTHTLPNAVEDFTGMLPPYTLLRRLGYRFSQLSLTEKIRSGSFRKRSEQANNDDE
ncbi:membrane protein [Bacteroides reticulotermitis]|uniref:Tyrosine-protein kinase Wzc n=2 Tax=Bacteroides reticulotermitis TaxID=1133319 RepID=W4UX74_9BACE|nr:membrane protein [Bacteroides reticulotermitis]MBB4044827.1 uncharacterized protein involved in exopolysaccharide biosynthesis [Bacteroides reticulotermitis]GAE85546.1 tyrosine-protein kinase Wzc [Bacteroides reticulotermitis JCM 10512]